MHQISVAQMISAIQGRSRARDRRNESFTAEAKEAEKTKLRAHLDQRKPQLSEEQLRFLLNYILGLPLIEKQSVIIPEIPRLVVASWTVNTRKRAEIWLERFMRDSRMLPARMHDLGHGRAPVMPPELSRWMPGLRKRA